MSTDTIKESELLLPHWAIGFANGKISEGAQLCTKDGRKTGNAVVFDIEMFPDNTLRACVITDYANVMVLSEAEIQELFHPPKYIMDVFTHKGVKEACLKQKNSIS